MILKTIGVLARIVIPVAILALGWYGYSVFSIEPEEKKKEAQAGPNLLRTKATTLRVGKYTVVVKTNGIVRPYNQVTLSAEVSGRVTKVADNFEVGAYFDKGDVLVELDDRDLKTALAVARARHKMAKSAHSFAMTSHERIVSSFRRNAAADADVDQAVANLAQSAAELDTAANQVEQAERDWERAKIVAPFAGRVQSKVIGVGQLVNPGTPLGDVFAVDFAEVRLPLAHRDLRYLDLPEMEADDPVPVVLRDGVDAASTTTWNATIVRTEGTLDQNSLELFAIARIRDPFGLDSNRPILRIGQPVIATISGRELDGVVAMPRKAVRQLDKVYLIDPEALTLKSKTIEPLWSDEESVVVRDPDIPDGILLATTKLVYAPEGAKVEIIPDIESEKKPSNPKLVADK